MGIIHDLACSVTGHTPDEIVQRVVSITEAFATSLKNNGMTLNMRKNKTECVATFCGPGGRCCELCDESADMQNPHEETAKGVEAGGYGMYGLKFDSPGKLPETTSST